MTILEFGLRILDLAYLFDHPIHGGPCCEIGVLCGSFCLLFSVVHEIDGAHRRTGECPDIIRTRLSPSGRSFGNKTRSFVHWITWAKNFMFWICFPIHQAKACMLAIRKDTPPPICTAGSSGCWATTFSTRWDTTLSACLPSNMRSRQELTRARRPSAISPTSGARSSAWATATIGTVSWPLPTRNTFAGLSGSSWSSSTPGSTRTWSGSGLTAGNSRERDDRLTSCRSHPRSATRAKLQKETIAIPSGLHTRRSRS